MFVGVFVFDDTCFDTCFVIVFDDMIRALTLICALSFFKEIMCPLID